MALARTLIRRCCSSPASLVVALALSLFAVSGCEQEEEPVFKLESPAVDVEVKKSDNGVEVEVDGEKDEQ